MVSYVVYLYGENYLMLCFVATTHCCRVYYRVLLEVSHNEFRTARRICQIYRHSDILRISIKDRKIYNTFSLFLPVLKQP